MRAVRIIAMLSALTVAIVTVPSAYAGSVVWSWAPSVLAMIFRAMLLLTVILIIVNLFICRAAAAVSSRVTSLLLTQPGSRRLPAQLLEFVADSGAAALLSFQCHAMHRFHRHICL